METLTLQVPTGTWLALRQQGIDTALSEATTMQVDIPPVEVYAASILTNLMEGTQFRLYKEDGTFLVDYINEEV